MEAGKEITSYNLSFQKKEHKPNVALYVFNHVVVAIDATGKNYKELPEILWGTFDLKYGEASFDQPESIRAGVDMKYISACIQEVAKDSGISEFWLYPYGEDRPDEKVKREQARLRLFKRYLNIVPASGGFGYILKV